MGVQEYLYEETQQGERRQGHGGIQGGAGKKITGEGF